MAKNAGRLAGLAALAGAAYMMSRGKDKGKSDDAGDQKTSSYTKDTKKVGSDGVPLKTPAESIKEADKSDKSTSISTKGESGTTTPGPDKSTPDLNENRNKPAPPKPKVEAQVDKDVKPKSVSEPSDKSVRLAPENRDLEKNTSRGIPAKQKPVSAVSSSEAGMKDYKPRRTTAAPAATTTRSATPVVAKPTTRSTNILEEAKEEARRRAAASQATRTSTPSSTSPVTRTPFPGSSALNKKHGGAVKKMASGGMTASRRADGIASRGKTRCKMY